MKHAYLIIAHNEPIILQLLISSLDDVRNDIYVHIDRKASFDTATLHTVKSKLCILPVHIDARWGDYSLVEVELLLFKWAYNEGPYGYYHLLSGVDMPIKNQNMIHNFFNKTNKEFIHFRNHNSFNDRIDRINYYHLFFKNARSNSKIKIIFSQKMHSICLKIQKLLRINRIKKSNINNYRDGANWFSITHDLAKYVVSLEKEIHNKYRYTYCADEIFLQTIVYNSKFYDNLYLYEDDNYDSIKRLIDWNRGSPYSFKPEDYNEIINSNNFFVRKIEDNELATEIYEKVMNKK